MKIRSASLSDIILIKELAQQIWWPTYGHILSAAQINFMLNDLYSAQALENQFLAGHNFIILENDEQKPAGFASYSVTENPQVYKILKIYLTQEIQGKGAGKLLMSYIEKSTKELGANLLELNVNRNNPAKDFYHKIGFTVLKEIDIPYHQFVLDDYVMIKSLR